MGCDIKEEWGVTYGKSVCLREREKCSPIASPFFPDATHWFFPYVTHLFFPICAHTSSPSVNRHVFFSFLLAQLRRRCPRPSLHPTVSHGEQGRYYEGPAAPRRRGGGRRQRERRRRRRSGRERTAVPIRRGDAAADAAAAVAGGRVGGTPTNALWELVHLAHRADRQTFARTHVHTHFSHTPRPILLICITGCIFLGEASCRVFVSCFLQDVVTRRPFCMHTSHRSSRPNLAVSPEGLQRRAPCVRGARSAIGRADRTIN